ncbi:alpha/beta fold hydrolase [Egicoccus halophilus]|uniref:alpha/beta fold hydrolase n=1 Tax=Egicoccus halophilus TaxID=1670830 RepID=UPI00197AD200|nr:alpha/beta fold hydrolase [Egicoccus halophilus]
MSAGTPIPASLPPTDLPGLDPAWSHLVEAVDAHGVLRTWHVLYTQAPGDPEPVGTLLCVHGNPTWSYLWRHVLAAPPPGWRVLAVDQLEMGYSERTGVDRRLGDRVADLGKLTDALELTGPVVTVAHDWGGPVALGWALAHREQLAGVVLTNTAVHQPDGAAAPRLIELARTPALLTTVCERTPTFVRGATVLSRVRGDRAVRDAYAAPYPSAAHRRGVAAFVRDIPLEADHPTAPVLDGIADGLDALADVPALLLWGGADPVFGDRYLHDLEARLPHAQVHRDGRANHLTPEDLEVAAHVRTFVATTRRSADASSDDGRSGDAGDADDAARSARVPVWARLDDPTIAERPAIVELPSRADASGPGAEATGAPRVLTFGALARRVRAVAAGLADLGVAPGDRVALVVPPGRDLATALYACWRIGAVVVLVDAGLGPRGMTSALRSAAPDHLIGIRRALAGALALRWPGRRIAAGPVPRALATAAQVAADLDGLAERGEALLASAGDAALPPAPQADDDAAVAFTSGSTGPAKGVAYRHRQLEAQRDALVATYDVGEDDRLVAAFAPFALYGPAMGVTSAVPDMDVTAPSTLTAAALADAVAAVDATLVFASPAALVNVRATAQDVPPRHRTALAGVRLLLSAGAPVPSELLRELTELMPVAEPHTPYGMTEALPVADISLAGIEAAGEGDGVCVGAPLTGVEVAVAPLDASGVAAAVPTDELDVVGELCVRAAHVKDRYDRLWATEVASATPAGWHRTGDVGHLDAQGRVWVEGRLVHVIVTADGVVTPVGIERRVERLSDASTGTRVRLAAAVGVGPTGTQHVVVVVQSDPPARRAGLAPRALTDAVRSAVDVPVAAVLTVPRIPVDIRHNSKIDRTAVAAWASAVLAGERAAAP